MPRTGRCISRRDRRSWKRSWLDMSFRSARKRESGISKFWVRSFRPPRNDADNEDRCIRRRDPRGDNMTLFDMSGKVAVITGSSRGIGRAIAERMAEHGAKVVISSRKQTACDEVAKA